MTTRRHHIHLTLDLLADHRRQVEREAAKPDAPMPHRAYGYVLATIQDIEERLRALLEPRHPGPQASRRNDPRIRTMFANGVNKAEIARELGYARCTVDRALKQKQ